MKAISKDMEKQGLKVELAVAFQSMMPDNTQEPTKLGEAAFMDDLVIMINAENIIQLTSSK